MRNVGTGDKNISISKDCVQIPPSTAFANAKVSAAIVDRDVLLILLVLHSSK